MDLAHKKARNLTKNLFNLNEAKYLAHIPYGNELNDNFPVKQNYNSRSLRY